MKFLRKILKTIDHAMASEIVYEYEITYKDTQNFDPMHDQRARTSQTGSTLANETSVCPICETSISTRIFEKHFRTCWEERQKSNIRTRIRDPDSRQDRGSIHSTRITSSHRSSERCITHASQAEKCPIFRMCQRFVNSLDWRPGYFNREYNRCYCADCYSPHLPDSYVVGNNPYVIPRGSCRFGLSFNPYKADVHDVWKTWANCYHGTTLAAAERILYHGELLLPGDRLLDGSELEIRPNHIQNRKFFYTSPSFKYASLNTYAPRTKWNDQYSIKIVLQCKQKPGTFIVQPETVGAVEPICSVISNDEIEWYSNTRSSCYPYGLLIQLIKDY